MSRLSDRHMPRSTVLIQIAYGQRKSWALMGDYLRYCAEGEGCARRVIVFDTFAEAEAALAAAGFVNSTRADIAKSAYVIECPPEVRS